nr:G protein-coupled receptor [Proales similis]
MKIKVVPREQTGDPRAETKKQISGKMNKFEQMVGQNRLLMRIFGMYHRKTDPVYLKIYPLTIVVLLWLNFLRFFSVYGFWYGETFDLSTSTVYQIINHLWILSCALNTTIVFINNESANRIARLYTTFSILLEHETSEQKKDIKGLNKRINILMAMALMIGAFNSFAVYLSYFGPDLFFSAFSPHLAPFHKSDWAKHNVPYKLLVAIINTILSVGWMLAVKQLFADCFIVCFFYKQFNKKFEEMTRSSILTSDDDPELDQSVESNFDEVVVHCSKTKLKTLISESTFEKHRIWHLKISFCVPLMDSCYSLMLTICITVYSTIALMIIFVLTGPSYNCVDPILKVMLPFWVFCGSFLVVMMILIASEISTLAHAPLEHVFNLPLKQYTNSICFKVSMMADFLRGERIGLTCLDFFVVCREILISIAGTVLTYVLVLVQFRDAGSGSNSC